MPPNQIACSTLEQKSVIKFLVAQKCKPYQIYRRKCDVYGDAFFLVINKRMFTNGLSKALLL